MSEPINFSSFNNGRHWNADARYVVDADDYDLAVEAISQLGIPEENIPDFKAVEKAILPEQQAYLDEYSKRGEIPEFVFDIPPGTENSGLAEVLDAYRTLARWQTGGRAFGVNSILEFRPDQWNLTQPEEPGDRIRAGLLLQDMTDPRDRSRPANLVAGNLNRSNPQDAAVRNISLYTLPGLVYTNMDADNQLDALAVESVYAAADGVMVEPIKLPELLVFKAKRLLDKNVTPQILTDHIPDYTVMPNYCRFDNIQRDNQVVACVHSINPGMLNVGYPWEVSELHPSAGVRRVVRLAIEES